MAEPCNQVCQERPRECSTEYWWGKVSQIAIPTHGSQSSVPFTFTSGAPAPNKDIYMIGTGYRRESGYRERERNDRVDLLNKRCWSRTQSLCLHSYVNPPDCPAGIFSISPGISDLANKESRVTHQCWPTATFEPIHSVIMFAEP